MNEKVYDMQDELKSIENAIDKENLLVLKMHENINIKINNIKILKNKKRCIFLKIENMKLCTHPDIYKLNEFLSEKEIIVILNGMDKTNYNDADARADKKYPRFLDLEDICKSIKKIKQLHKDWELYDLCISFSQDSCPPRSSYKYTYKDSDKNKYDMGGVKVTIV